MCYNIDIIKKGVIKMIIKEKDCKIDFNDLSQGEVFYHDGFYKIKTEYTEDSDGKINCVILNTGKFDYIDPLEGVQPVTALLNVSKK